MPTMTSNSTKLVRVAASILGIGLMALLGVASARTVTYYYTDVQGTPLALTDASGNVIKVLEKSPYGRPFLDSDERGLTGHVTDDETSLIYMQARFYDPGIARFLSTDPVPPLAGRRINLQRYTYVDNNPFTFKDPSGKVLHADQPGSPGDDSGCGHLPCDKREGNPDVQLGVLDDYLGARGLSWLKGLWRGQAAHKVIENDIRIYAARSGIETRIEESFVTADGGRLRVDVMMRRGDTSAWSVFEIKPDNPRSAYQGSLQAGGYVAELQRVDRDSKLGTWSEFFSTSYRDVHVPSIMIGKFDFGGTYVYGPDENWRGVITYETADSPVSRGD